jgi:hypothetical protein
MLQLLTARGWFEAGSWALRSWSHAMVCGAGRIGPRCENGKFITLEAISR